MADGNVKDWETDRYKNKYSYKAALAAGIIAFLLLAVSAALAQDITGTWLRVKKDSKIMIYRNPDKTYSGKIVWAASTDRQCIM